MSYKNELRENYICDVGGVRHRYNLNRDNTGITMGELYELLKSIVVTNWYLGQITAFAALSNCATMNKSDQGKVRRAVAKLGYKCRFKRGYIDWIYKP